MAATRTRRIADVIDVAERNLCTGCGTCAFLAPDEIAMVDDVTDGRRPVRIGSGPLAVAALDACPGVHLEHDPAGFAAGVQRRPAPALGARRRAVGGPRHRHVGAATGVERRRRRRRSPSIGCSGASRGVLHVRAAAGEPWRNEPVLSRTAASVLAAPGSRYAPASPGEGLALVEAAPGPCVVIGKPCDIASVRQAARLRPELAERIDLTIAVFCAGTPSTAGTLEMLAAMGVSDLGDVRSLAYRGDGWPGRGAGCSCARGREPRPLSYEQSWGEILAAPPAVALQDLPRPHRRVRRHRRGRPVVAAHGRRPRPLARGGPHRAGASRRARRHGVGRAARSSRRRPIAWPARSRTSCRRAARCGVGCRRCGPSACRRRATATSPPSVRGGSTSAPGTRSARWPAPPAGSVRDDLRRPRPVRPLAGRPRAPPHTTGERRRASATRGACVVDPRAASATRRAAAAGAPCTATRTAEATLDTTAAPAMPCSGSTDRRGRRP